jgi:hypothetical protein
LFRNIFYQVYNVKHNTSNVNKNPLQVTQAIDQLHRRETRIQPILKKQHLQEKKVVEKIKNKLDTNKAMVTKADKGNAMVIYTNNNTTKKQ